MLKNRRIKKKKKKLVRERRWFAGERGIGWRTDGLLENRWLAREQIGIYLASVVYITTNYF